MLADKNVKKKIKVISASQFYQKIYCCTIINFFEFLKEKSLILMFSVWINKYRISTKIYLKHSIWIVYLSVSVNCSILSFLFIRVFIPPPMCSTHFLFIFWWCIAFFPIIKMFIALSTLCLLKCVCLTAIQVMLRKKLELKCLPLYLQMRFMTHQRNTILICIQKC